MKIVNVKINVPLAFCEFAIRNKLLSSFRLYIYLKTTCNGQILIDAKTKQTIAKDLHVTVKTITNQLKKLHERNWVGYNPKSGYYFIRGFNKVRDIEQFQGRRGVWIDTHKDFQTISRFRAFVMGAIIGQLSNVSKQRAKKTFEERRPEHIKGSSNHRLRPHLPLYYPVACHALASIYGISISTASRYKHEADEHGFIDLKKNFRRLALNGDPKEYDAQFATAYKASHPDEAHKIRIKNNKVYIQEADQVQARMNYTKKYRLRPKKRQNLIHLDEQEKESPL